jgi:amino acid permease
MVGSSLVSIPWAFSQGGLVLSLIITLVVFIVSFYTCYLVLKAAKNDEDYADTVYKYFGSKGWLFTMGMSILLIFSVLVIYYELMS